MTPIWPANLLPFSPKLSSSVDKVLVFDLETNGFYNDVTQIFCIVIHDVKRNQTLSFGPDSIDSALSLLADADVLIGHKHNLLRPSGH